MLRNEASTPVNSKIQYKHNNTHFMDSYSSPLAPRPNMPPMEPLFDRFDDEPDFRPGGHDEIITATVVSEPREVSPPKARKSRLPLWLFIATCIEHIHGLDRERSFRCPAFFTCRWWKGYNTQLRSCIILGCHEMGHYLQARRYRIQASLPFFIPMPISPIGTMGAVIAMQSRMGDRKSLFDIGISGPLAGLVPTLICCVVGLHLSEVVPVPPNGLSLGEPLLFSWLAQWIVGPVPPGYDVMLHPIAFAGWVGLLITALNLMPIGQLDGGHVLYGLVRKKAHLVAKLLLFGALAAMIIFQFWGWMLMVFLLIFIGPEHPPTANDNVGLGPVRTVLGWATLAFIPIGFTPIPFNL